MAPKRPPGLAAPEVEDTTGAQNVVEGIAAWETVVVIGDSVVLLVASPGNCRAFWGLPEEEPVVVPADPAVNPPDEISVG